MVSFLVLAAGNLRAKIGAHHSKSSLMCLAGLGGWVFFFIFIFVCFVPGSFFIIVFLLILN